MSYDLDKLGTVLAVANQINRDMLEILKKQQEKARRLTSLFQKQQPNMVS